MRWADMDAFGHVNNVVYLRYLQEARVEMMFNRGRDAGVTSLEDGVVVARHELDYRMQLQFRPRPVRVESWVSQLSAASFVIGYEIVEPAASGHDEAGDRVVYSVASSLLVPYDLECGRPRRVSDEEHALLEPYLDPDGPTPRGAQR